MSDSVPLQLLLQLFLIMLNAIFACAEIAVLSISDAKLNQYVANGNKKAKRLSKLTSQPAKFLATIQVAITLAGFLGSAFAADNFSDRIVSWLVGLGVKIPEKTLNTISVIVITLILSYFTLVFGELVPKRIAMKKSESVALGLSATVTFISKLFAPIVWLLTASTNGILKLFGIDPNETGETVTEDEIKLMVDEGSEKGTIDVQEKELIQNVFEFDDLTAEEIATRRTDISLLWMDETVEQWENTINESRHTLYPVCDESIDNVIAVLNAKDYFRLKDKSRENIMANATKPPYFVPESVKADVLFANMKKQRDFFAVVLDEYGGMSGIITVTDLLECIVGDFDGGNRDDEEIVPDIEPIDSTTWKINGTTPVEDVEEALDVKLECEDCDTFAGYLLSILGAIPDDGAELSVETDHLSVRITEVREHRIEKTVVCLKDPEPSDEGDKEKEKEKEDDGD